MEEYQKRMLDEAKELSERIEKLNRFIALDERFKKLPTREQVLMRQQLNAMQLYRYFLEQRISNIQIAQTPGENPA